MNKILYFFTKRLMPHDWQVRQASAARDMSHDQDEAYYAGQYLYWIRPVLEKSFADHQAIALDLGCGQGRLTVPLAAYCRAMTGVDFTPQAIDRARDYAREAGCRNVNFICSDGLAYLRQQPDASIDFAVFTEVTFFLPSYKEVLSQIYRVLKPGGTAFMSFRSQWFDILHSIRSRKWGSALMAIEKREGNLWGGGTWFSWHTRGDIEALLKRMGFQTSEFLGIGVCSGIEGDPLDDIARPSRLDEREREKLGDIERRLAAQYPENGRYILTMARKP